MCRQCSWAGKTPNPCTFVPCIIHQCIIICNVLQCSWAGKTPNPCTAFPPLCTAAYINTLCSTVFQYIVLHCLVRKGKHKPPCMALKHWHLQYLVLINQIVRILICICTCFLPWIHICICVLTCMQWSAITKGASMVLSIWLSNPVHLKQSQEKENQRWIVLKR